MSLFYSCLNLPWIANYSMPFFVKRQNKEKRWYSKNSTANNLVNKIWIDRDPYGSYFVDLYISPWIQIMVYEVTIWVENGLYRDHENME